jgi:hypothetical protein
MGWYDNPIPIRFLAPIDCLKIPALVARERWEAERSICYVVFELHILRYARGLSLILL